MVTVMRIVIRTPTIPLAVGTSQIFLTFATGKKVIVDHEDCSRTPTILVTSGNGEIFEIKTTTVTRMAPPRPPKRGRLRGSQAGHPPSL